MDAADRFASVVNENSWLNELIRHAACIRRPHRFDRVSRFVAFPENHRAKGPLDALPAAVAVHGVVASRNGGDAAVADFLHHGSQLANVAGAAFRWHVAAVGKAVNVNVLDACPLRHLEQRIKVVCM